MLAFTVCLISHLHADGVLHVHDDVPPAEISDLGQEQGRPVARAIA